MPACCHNPKLSNILVIYNEAGRKQLQMLPITFGVIITFSLFQCGLSIMCYECNSATNSLCADAVLPSSLMRNCSEHDRGVTHTLCRKIVQHVDFGHVNGQLPTARIVRSCGWDETKYKGVCYHRAGYGGRQEVCSCSSDYCNSSHQHLPSILLATLLTALLLKICQ